MDLIFNELSILPLSKDKTESYKRVEDFVKAFKSAAIKGFTKIRFEKQFNEIELSPQYTLDDYCNTSTNRNYKSLLLGIRKYPFIDNNSEQEISYIKNRYYIYKNGKKENCFGLAAAYLYSTSGIGFLPEPFWNKVKFKIIIENSNYQEDYVYCISHKDHIGRVDFQSWLENLGKINLIESTLSANEKEIKLRDDHGKDILQRFSQLLVQSPYILKIINSLPYNPRNKEFIKKTYPDGKIEIVLTKTDKGLGVIVQTTGRNRRETVEIAKILEQKFYN